MHQPGRNLLCVRKVEESNRDSTYAELLSAINILGVGDYWEQRVSPLGLQCKNGNGVLFRGVNDASQREKLKSITFINGKLTDVWIEEASEITRDDFDIIDDRLRGELPKGLFYQIRLTFNPVPCWIKARFFDFKDPDACICETTYLDNKFIDKAFLGRMERRRELDPEGFRIYGLGEWGELGGIILPNIKVETFPISFDERSMGQDFGYNHYNAIVQCGFKNNDLYVYSELCVNECTTAEIIEKAAGRVPKDLTMYCDAAEPDRIREWLQAGYSSIPATKGGGSVKAQIDWLKARTIHVLPSCPHIIKELQGWKWKKDRVTGQYVDEPIPIDDDAIAALRYATEKWRIYGTQEKHTPILDEYEVEHFGHYYADDETYGSEWDRIREFEGDI